jgi:23S rRNA (cytosine1962-C5)-methyltransferase
MAPRATVSRRGVDRIRAGHPWIYRSDVVDVDAEAGDVVSVASERGRPLGWAFFSSTSLITLRMLTTDASDVDADTLVTKHLDAAADYRESLNIDASAWRVVNGEADRLPATVVDRYGEGDDAYFVVQTLSQGSDRRRDHLVRWLARRFGPRGVLARNDPKVRQLEGLESTIDVLFGEIPERLTVVEGAVKFTVDLRSGQKTGLFLDQRENHLAAASYARGRVLDAFTYNGGFGLHMARRAEHVLAIDSSPLAVQLTEANARTNAFANVEVREANVFDELREREIAGDVFDTITLDPPAFAKNKASVERAWAGYKEINLRALRLLRPGGHLITCSCSYNVDETMFLEIVREAAVDAHAPIWLVEKRMQGRDHPVLAGVPETHYLKCLILRKLS